jgi:hypothetical protein
MKYTKNVLKVALRRARESMEIALHLLAIIAGTGSVSLYLAAFFFPEVHRRHDFFWSGVGCFYALILWLDAGQISPTELLGHAASISLMGWLGWQTLTLRRKRTPLSLQTPYTADSWPTFRREMTALALDALGQTPLHRWLPRSTSEPSAPKPGIRISGLKEVGYEFVDSVEPPKPIGVPKHSGWAKDIEVSPTLPQRSNPVVNRPADPPPQATPMTPPIATPIPGPKAMTWGQRVQELVAWGQDLLRAKTTSKPKKPVIEIPPRPSSLAKRSTADTQAEVPSAPAPPGEPSPVVSGTTPMEEPAPHVIPNGSLSPISVEPNHEETSNWEDNGAEDEDWI